jgi:hypothetical protein
MEGQVKARLCASAVFLAAIALPADGACHPNPVAMRWLTESCGVGEPNDSATELRNEGRKAQKTLILAFTGGPSQEDIDDVVAEADREYEDSRIALNTGRAEGFSNAAIDAMRAITKEDEIRDAREDFIAAYKSAAASGLAILALDKGIKLLRRVARDDHNPDQAIAAAALEREAIPLTPP